MAKTDAWLADKLQKEFSATDLADRDYFNIWANSKETTMRYLGNTEQSSPTPVIEIGKKYWLRSRVNGSVKLEECVPSPIYHTTPCFVMDLLAFERFDVFGPVVDEANQPDFDALIKDKENNHV